LKNTPQTPFLFFAQACSVGKHFNSEYSQTSNLGLASIFIKHNVIFIGAHWEVSERGSDIFVRSLYSELINRPDKPIGELMKIARLKVIQELASNKPNYEWLAFTLNGDPSSRLIWK